MRIRSFPTVRRQETPMPTLGQYLPPTAKEKSREDRRKGAPPFIVILNAQTPSSPTKREHKRAQGKTATMDNSGDVHADLVSNTGGFGAVAASSSQHILRYHVLFDHGWGDCYVSHGNEGQDYRRKYRARENQLREFHVSSR